MKLDIEGKQVLEGARGTGRSTVFNCVRIWLEQYAETSKLHKFFFET